MNIQTTIFGYPRIGPNRELKKAVESYWRDKISKEELLKFGQSITIDMAATVKNFGIEIVPSNEFSFYDFVLDISLMFDVVPERFRKIVDPLEKYFAMARGNENAAACEMTKWFNTNYHYIVPEVNKDTEFQVRENKPLKEFKLIKEKLNIITKPVVLGAFTYLKLAKIDFCLFESVFPKVCQSYNRILKELEENGAREVQLDEPWLVMDIDEKEIDILIAGYEQIMKGLKNLKVYVQTYYEALSYYEKIVYGLPIHGFGFDLVDGKQNIDNIIKYGFPENKILIAGVVSGRDPWKTDYSEVLKIIEKISKRVKTFMISNSSPLFHLPVSVEPEKGHLPDEILGFLSFANERLKELVTIKEIIDGKDVAVQNTSQINRLFTDPEIRKMVQEVDKTDIERKPSFKERYEQQMKKLNLPLFPTTTIGSFPQTSEIRRKRAQYKSGEITKEEYEKFILKEIKKAIEIQEDLGIDVLVHGEFERTDMVEFFAEKLDGFVCTKNGWVQSYGTRCVKPPIIYGDIKRVTPLTLKETLYAQSLTKKPVKGILTGPVTILQWSFPRKDISKKEIAYQIALALKEEVLELEKAGIKIIQIDEPAFREGLPLKKHQHKEYFEWAVKSFKIVCSAVKPETQIHTHMCYSEFKEIISEIYALDADVISIEASRSKGDILDAFEKFKYDHGIGIGVYDIHSPRVPTVEEIIEIVRRSIKYIDKSLFWINPDCGLKTRQWEETINSLKNMVKAANIMREDCKS